MKNIKALSRYDLDGKTIKEVKEILSKFNDNDIFDIGIDWGYYEGEVDVKIWIRTE